MKAATVIVIAVQVLLTLALGGALVWGAVLGLIWLTRVVLG